MIKYKRTEYIFTDTYINISSNSDSNYNNLKYYE